MAGPARDKRDYLWLMARTPQISDVDYRALLARSQAPGYDVSKVIKAPQRWPEADPSGPPAQTCGHG